MHSCNSRLVLVENVAEFYWPITEWSYGAIYFWHSIESPTFIITIVCFRNIKIRLHSQAYNTETKEIEIYVNHLSHSCYSFLLFLSSGTRYQVEFGYFESGLIFQDNKIQPSFSFCVQGGFKVKLWTFRNDKIPDGATHQILLCVILLKDVFRIYCRTLFQPAVFWGIVSTDITELSTTYSTTRCLRNSKGDQ